MLIECRLWEPMPIIDKLMQCLTRGFFLTWRLRNHLFGILLQPSLRNQFTSSSIGTTAPCWVLTYSTVVEYSQQESFYRVPLPEARQTPNLKDELLERSNFRHKGVPSV